MNWSVLGNLQSGSLGLFGSRNLGWPFPPNAFIKKKKKIKRHNRFFLTCIFLIHIASLYLHFLKNQQRRHNQGNLSSFPCPSSSCLGAPSLIIPFVLAQGGTRRIEWKDLRKYEKKSQQMALESSGDRKKIPLTHSKAIWARLMSEETRQAKEKAAAARGRTNMHSAVLCSLPAGKAGQIFLPPSPVSTTASFIYFILLQLMFNLQL